MGVSPLCVFFFFFAIFESNFEETRDCNVCMCVCVHLNDGREKRRQVRLEKEPC